MKYKSLILATFVGALSIPTVAQEKPKVEPQRIEPQIRPGFGALVAPLFPPPRRVQLDLTEEQKQQIEWLRKILSAAVRELFQNQGLAPQDKRDQLRDLSIDLQTAIKAIYTPEQRAQLAKAEQEAIKRREEMQKLRIVLSDEQKAKVRELSAKRMHALKQARELPQEER